MTEELKRLTRICATMNFGEQGSALPGYNKRKYESTNNRYRNLVCDKTDQSGEIQEIIFNKNCA